MANCVGRRHARRACSLQTLLLLLQLLQLLLLMQA
jgi:hypothetical protein